MKKVTTEQIDALYKFTRKHYVEYYDVQTELVDHLGNAIEKHWENAPDEDFETVLEKEFKKFGVFGFMNIIEQKRSEMSKYYYKLLWRKTKKFFTFPKIMLTILLSLLNFSFISLFTDMKLGMNILSIPTFISIIISMIISRKKYRSKTKRKWLFHDVIFQMSGLLLIFNPFLNLNFQNIIINNFHVSLTFAVIYSFLMALNYIIIYLASYYFPKNVENYLKEIYPEYRAQLQLDK